VAPDPLAATAALIDSLGAQSLAKAASYTAGNHWLLLWNLVAGGLVAWVVVRSGLLDKVDARIGRRGPNARAFAAGAALPAPVTEGATAADGVRVCAPPRGAEVLEAVRRSDGSVEEVGEEEIEEARRALWRKGYAVESTGALAAACVFRLGNALRRRHGDLAVVLTGTGLKH